MSAASELRVAVAFLTPLHLTPAGTTPPPPTPRSMAYFPLVGGAIGALVGLTWRQARRTFPPLLSAALAVAADCALTGALHLDGLADTADGLLAHVPSKDRLEIMAEPGTGSFAAVAVGLALLTRAASLGGPRAVACAAGGAVLFVPFCDGDREPVVALCPTGRPGVSLSPRERKPRPGRPVSGRRRRGGVGGAGVGRGGGGPEGRGGGRGRVGERPLWCSNPPAGESVAIPATSSVPPASAARPVPWWWRRGPPPRPEAVVRAEGRPGPAAAPAWARPVPVVGDTTSAADRAAHPESWRFGDSERQAFYDIVMARRDIRRFRPDPLDPNLVERVLTAAHAGTVGGALPAVAVPARDRGRDP